MKLSWSKVSQSGLSSTQTLNTSEPELEAHIESTPAEHLSTPKETDANEKAKKGGLGITYHSANILRERTTNKMVESDAKQQQRKLLVRRKPDALEGVDKDHIKLKLKSSGLRLQNSDQENSKKSHHGEDENSACRFKQPAMPKVGRVSNGIVRQRSLGSLSRPDSMGSSNQRPNKPSSEYSMGGSRMTLESQVRALRRQTSAGCGVRVLAPPQLMPQVQPTRVILPPPNIQLEGSAPVSRLRPPSRIASAAGSRLRLPGVGGSFSRLPLMGQK